MKLKINKDSLNKVLNFLNTGIPSKIIVPVESMVLFTFEAAEDRCTIRISNSGVEMSAYIKVECEEDIEFCVPINMISRTVATFPDGHVQIEPKYNKETEALSAISLKPEGQRKRYKIACYPPGDFIKWPVPEEHDFSVKISMKELSEKLRIIASNVDTKDIRPQFSNIQMIQQDGKMSFISGNVVMIGQLVTDIDIPEGRIIPQALAKYVSMFTDGSECEMKFTDNHIILEYSSIRIITKLIEGKVVDYTKLFVAESDKEIEIVREDLLGALTRLGIFSDEENRIDITTEGDLMHMYVSNGDNEGEETIDIQNPTNRALDVRINYQLLKTSVSNIKSDNITLSQSEHENFKNIFIRPTKDSKKELWMFAPFVK